ncbi:MAG: tetratricopeptide repeat protein [Planctomycetes bacterium]|nr:tetratricopeptide repeat protein [Planctomycetota bacterium]
MNSSREWGDDPDQVAAERDPEFTRRLVRASLVLLVVIGAVAAAWAGWSKLRTRSGESLRLQARAMVRGAAINPSASVKQLRNAEALLREYLDRNGENEDDARLLLCAAMTLRALYDPDRRISEATEIEELLNNIHPSACPLEDLLAISDIFIHSGKLAQADWLLGAALRQSEGTPEHGRILRLAIGLRYDLGHEKEVLELCAQLAELEPGDPEPWRRMSMVYEDGGYDEKMIESLQRVIQLDQEGSSKERLKLIDALITIGERVQARAEFNTLAAKAPEVVAQHPLTEAKLLMLEGDTSTAAAMVDRILAADPEATEAMLFRSQLLLSQNRLQDAAELLNRLLELDAMNFQAHYVMGQVCARQGEREQAEHHLALHRQILDTRVKIHTLERRAGRNPHDEEARSELIRLYQALGMSEQAEFWRRAAQSSGFDG